jgi:hypothetical protein
MNYETGQVKKPATRDIHSAEVCGGKRGAFIKGLKFRPTLPPADRDSPGGEQ